MRVVPFKEESAAAWDQLVAAAHASTLLHTRKFLSYHGSRFADFSLMILDGKQHLIGIFPAALNPTCKDMVVSHPGATYGGLIHAGELSGERTVIALSLIRQHYLELGITHLRYKALPHIYHVAPSQDDLYALFRLGAQRYRCDLSCAIDLAARLPTSGRRRRALKNAKKNNLVIVSGVEFASPIWSVLEENLARKHATRPVHTLHEITMLHELFPEQIEFIAALHNGMVIAGTVLFHSAMVTHAQYIASSEEGYNLHALDALFEWCINRAQKSGCRRFFDFGISNENEGRILNSGLYDFKTEFGGGGVVHEFFELDLHRGHHAT